MPGSGVREAVEGQVKFAGRFPQVIGSGFRKLDCARRANAPRRARYQYDLTSEVYHFPNSLITSESSMRERSLRQAA